MSEVHYFFLFRAFVFSICIILVLTFQSLLLLYIGSL
jgi:hypothetical protein